MTPLPLQMAFSQIHKKFEPDVGRRGRLFETAMMRLTQWWQEVFFHANQRGHGEVQNRTFDEVAAELRRKGYVTLNLMRDISNTMTESHQYYSDDEDDEDDDAEIIRSSKSLQKHALSRRGSRDVSSQLFTALCRGLGIPARLVVSIQSTPWRASIGKSNLADPAQNHSSEGDTHKGKAKAFPGVGQALNGSSTVEKGSSDNKGTKPAIHLRRQRPKGRRLGTVKKGCF